jgi:rhamnogalacturonyl hydrolase YesR
LYHEEAPFDGKYIYPEAPEYDNTVAFPKIFEGEQGDLAYALTYALSDTELKLSSDANYDVFVNSSLQKPPYFLKNGDEVLVKMKNENSFSFTFEGDLGLPMVRSMRGGGDQWLTLGLFTEEEGNYTPEDGVQFKKPYRSGKRSVFFKFAHRDDYLRPYLLTRFFGQWHYTFMVGSYGLLRASETLGEQEYFDYFKEHMRLMVEYFDYMRYEHEHFSSPSFLDISSTLHDLDSIGSIGRNLCEYYFRTKDEDTLPILDTMLQAMETNIPRFEDGIFHRERDMWADDTFMSCPFLVRMASIKGERRYAEEAVKQLLGFKKRLFIEEEELFSHIFFLSDETANRIPWGRGNGWVFVSMADVLSHAPKDTPGYEELSEVFVRFARGLARVQDTDGLWHQVLNRRDSYSETSCTALFSIGMCQGMRLNILGEEYKGCVERAYRGILAHKVDENAYVYGVCMGSGNAREAEYYMNLGTVDNDDHGTGVVLTMLSEVDELFQGNI